MASLCQAFSVLALLISGLGMFALSSHAAELQRKEMAIRRTFGATFAQISALVMKGHLRLVVIAVLAAAPLGGIALVRWLQDFAYRADLSHRVFLLSGLMALGVGALATITQAVQVAKTEPIVVLREE